VFGKEPYAFSKVEMKDGTVNEIVVYMHFIEVSQNDRVDDSTDDTGLSIEVVILIITNIVTFLISVIGIPVLWFYLKSVVNDQAKSLPQQPPKWTTGVTAPDPFVCSFPM